MKQQRPSQHEINDISEAQLELSIKTRKWVITPIDPDYGEDYWVRVFNEGNFSGLTFYVQLKGTDNIEDYRLKGSNNFSIEIDTKHLKQWLKFPVPVLVILWDIDLKQGYWVDIQQHIVTKLIEDTDWLSSDNRNIHIPSSQLIDLDAQDGFNQHAVSICEERLLHEKDFLYRLRQYSYIAEQSLALNIEHSKIPVGIAYQQRLIELDMLLSLIPSNASLWAEKASIYYAQYDMENSLLAINKAVELEPDNNSWIWNRACALAEYALTHGGNPRSMLEEALEIFRSKDLSDPVNRYYNIGNSLAGLSRHSEAIEQYDLALKENPESKIAAPIWKNKGTSLFHLGRHEEEFACYKKALELNPILWEAYTSWATTDIRLENYQHAEELLKQALEIDELVVHYGFRQSYWLAFCQWKNNKLQEAYQTVSTVLTQKPGDKDARHLKASILAQLWRSKPEEYRDVAIEYFATLFLDEPENPMVQIELFLLYKEDEPEKAKRVLDHTLELEDVPAQALYHHAMMLRGEGKPQEAIQAMEKAFAKSQEHHIIHNMAHLKKDVGDYQESIKFYQMALDDCSNPDGILQDIADCYQYLNKFDECARLMMTFLKKNPNNMLWWGNLGYALLQLGVSDITFDSFADVYEAVKLTVERYSPIDSLLQMEISRLFSTLENVIQKYGDLRS